jgi:uncharacterized iron-regulated protein
MAIRSEVNDLAEPPLTFLARMAKHNRLLGFGEGHVEGPERAFGAAMIRPLKDAGVTHLAVEMPQAFQKQLLAYVETGNRSTLTSMPYWLKGTEYVRMLDAAKQSEMEIVAVDVRRKFGYDHKPRAEFLDDTLRRDQEMANKISHVLDSDSGNQVAYWVGAGHLQSHQGSREIVAAALLSQRYPIHRVYNVPTVWQTNRLNMLVPDITSSAAVPIEKSTLIRGLHTGTEDWRYGSWDSVLLHPVRRASKLE